MLCLCRVAHCKLTDIRPCVDGLSILACFAHGALSRWHSLSPTPSLHLMCVLFSDNSFEVEVVGKGTRLRVVFLENQHLQQ